MFGAIEAALGIVNKILGIFGLAQQEAKEKTDRNIGGDLNAGKEAQDVVKEAVKANAASTDPDKLNAVRAEARDTTIPL